MNLADESVLAATESVCPACLARIPAWRVARGDDVHLVKTCPRHGDFDTVVWRGHPAFATWLRPSLPGHPAVPFTAVDGGCPFDCGLCPEHRQPGCCVLLEVTQRCDLHCPVCFAGSGKSPRPDPDLKVIAGWFRRLLETGDAYNIQLSGGEPCLRDDLPEVIKLGRSLGFQFFQVNTNGLRIAREPDYLRRLQDAGLSTVFLQFDGVRQESHERLRGRRLLAHKQAAVERCAEHKLGVVLVPTLVPGINTDDIGGIIAFGLDHAPHVRGVHFQPISYFGRYPQPPGAGDRVTLPETMRAIEAQTGGLVQCSSFKPPAGRNATCSFNASLVIMPDGRLVPLTRHEPDASCCCKPERAAEGSARARQSVARYWSAPSFEEVNYAGPSLGEWDVLLARTRTHTFTISGMAFQDAWTLDLERLRECCVHVVGSDGKIIPFCAYNLTDRRGRSLYRAKSNQPS